MAKPKDPPYSTVRLFYAGHATEPAALNHALVWRARGGWPRGEPTAGVRQPVGENHGERRPSGYDAGKKIKAASATSSPTRKAIWSAGRHQADIRIAMAPRRLARSLALSMAAPYLADGG